MPEVSYLSVMVVLGSAQATMLRLREVPSAPIDLADLQRLIFLINEACFPELNAPVKSLTLCPGVPELGWSFFQESFLFFDLVFALCAVLQSAAATAIVKEDEPREASTNLIDIAELVDKGDESIRQRANDVRDRLQESGVVGKIVDAVLERDVGEGDGVGPAMEEIVGVAGTEIWVSSVIDSWIEGIDGLLRLKPRR
jgi:hypothetical protein